MAPGTGTRLTGRPARADTARMGASPGQPLPVVQFTGRPGVLDLGWGHPAGWALPTEQWSQATATALRRHGVSALAYGFARGPGPLVEWLADRLGRLDGRAPDPAELFVTAGASAGLELACAALVRPGDAVVVDSPTYHLALRIIADHAVQLVPAPADADGIDPDGTAGLVGRLRAAGRRVPMLYLVPTFANPTGGCLPRDRREALVDLAHRTGTTVVEDDCYRELGYDAPAPASLWSRSGGTGVLRIGSFAKTVAPGLRLGFLTGPRRVVEALTRRGVVDSGGGLNHTTALAMAEFGVSGGYQRHLDRIVTGYRGQRDALAAALGDRLGVASFRRPGGGWFVWLRLPDWAPAGRLLEHATSHGVSFLPGPTFHVTDSGDRHLRLSFSLYGPAQLTEAVARLARALDDLAAAG